MKLKYVAFITITKKQGDTLDASSLKSQILSEKQVTIIKSPHWSPFLINLYRGNPKQRQLYNSFIKLSINSLFVDAIAITTS